MSEYKLVGPFSQLLPMTKVSLRGALFDNFMRIIDRGAIIIKDDRVWKIGEYKTLKKEAEFLQAEIYHIEGKSVCLPGFIDCHTHICFGGNRALDFAKRNSGVSYLEIATAGGGIQDTVAKTRKTTKKDLIVSLEKRASRHFAEGVTTMEVKSGYGLDVESELKMLEAIKEANTKSDLISTCLAAHTLPKTFEGTKQEYLDFLLNDLLPVVKEKNLSDRVDIFIEESAFGIKESESYLKKAKELGFNITVHADQFSSGGSGVACRVGALSADHLETSGSKDIATLAKSNTVAVALPGASLGLGVGFAPARKLLDAGATLAIASDWNPGSAPMGDLLLQATVLATYEKLSNAEIFAGITVRAAAALGLQDRGKLADNYLADFILFETNDFREITWNQGKLKPFQVWKNGIRSFPL